MQPQPDKIDRKMVPRWRTLSATPAAELPSSRHKAQPIKIMGADEVKADWKENRELWTAAEVLATVPLVGRDAITDEAAAFLKAVEDTLPPEAQRILVNYLGGDTSLREGEFLPDSRVLRYKAIVDAKAIIRAHPRAAIAYVDMARLQVSLGQRGAAERAMSMALAITPQNRFVLRSAIRLFVHEGDLDRAWHIIRHCSEQDPWLMASRIAVADIAHKPLPSLKIVKTLVERVGSSQRSELAASSATLELGSGNFKQARRLFGMSATEPTENTVAQLRWASEHMLMPFDEALLQTTNSFEARTALYQSERMWKEAGENAVAWLADEPFSLRAAITACFIYSECIRDFDKVILLSNMGIFAAPQSAEMYNNKAFAYANVGKTALARETLEKAKNLKHSDITKCCLIATYGCILYREGDSVGGARKYSEAIDLALSLGLKNVAELAYLHFISEEVNTGKQLDPATKDFAIGHFSKSDIESSIKAIFLEHVLPILENKTSEEFIPDVAKLSHRIFSIDWKNPTVSVVRPTPPALQISNQNTLPPSR
jgi:tetratricopeptide (TPR) repeat protein